MTEESRRRLVEAAPGFGIRVLASAATEASALPSVLSAIEALDVMGKGWVKLEAGQAEHVGPNIRHAIRNSSKAQVADGHDRSQGALLPNIGAPASGPEPPPPKAAEVAAFSGTCCRVSLLGRLAGGERRGRPRLQLKFRVNQPRNPLAFWRREHD
jgi:hypothetical protein